MAKRPRSPGGPPPPAIEPPASCSVCFHVYARNELTRHHLVPKSRKGKVTIPVCRACHRQIHALFTEKELERSCGTLEELLAAEAMQPWITWVRRRKPRGRIAVRTSRRKSRR